MSEGAVCSVFPGCVVHPNPAGSWSSNYQEEQKIATVLPTVTLEPGLTLGER